MAWTTAGVILVFLQIFIAVATGLNCGYPGSPAFGRPQPLRDTYKPGEFVSYACSLGYFLQGPVSRQCQENGTWSGKLPVCDTSISSVNHVASSRATLSLYTPDKAIDGDRTSCTYTDKKKPRWVRVDLKEPYLIQSVAITVPKNIYTSASAQFTIYIISVRDRSTASYHKCAYLNGKFSTETVKLTCSGGSIYGQYIHIEDNRNDVDYFSICEIDVFVKRDSYDCGTAERPTQAFNLNTEAGVVHYRCVYGYRLEGPSARRCLPNGQWSDEQPVCQEISCPALNGIEHGRVHYIGVMHGRLTLGTLANFSCDYGYQLSGITSLRCTESGKWSEGIASCQPVDCQVPTVRNSKERYIILNGTTTYGSMVLLYCGDNPDDENTQSVIRTCREDGVWSPVDMECTPQNMLAKLGLVDEVESTLPTGLIVGMVIVVLLLVASILLIFLIRRKGLLRGESNHSLPSKDTASSCVGSTNGKPTLYDNDTFYASIAVENIDGKQPEAHETNDTFAQSSNSQTPNRKGILSTILFAKRKAFSNRPLEADKHQEDSTTSNGLCVYEEIGKRPNIRDKKKSKDGELNTNTPNGPPIYAQVDFDEKRKSRLVKSLCDKFDCDIPSGDGQYHSVEAPTFDELDSEPIKLRELPPIPTDDDESSVTYASLSRPPEPPETDVIHMRDNSIYGGSIYSSAPDCDSSSIMKDNDLYLVQ